MFTVEDGTIVAGANAYAAVAAVDSYWADRGTNAAWQAASADAKKAAIIRATDYIERRFGGHFRGHTVSAAQALEWPRADAADNDGNAYADDAMPLRLIYATAEYAMRALAGDLLAAAPAAAADLNQLAQQQGGRVTAVREKVDVLETEVNYAQGAGRSSARLSTTALASDSAIPEIPAGDLWLEELIRSTQGGANGVQFGRLARA